MTLSVALRTANKADAAAIRAVAEVAWWETYPALLPEGMIAQVLAAHYDDTTLHRHIEGAVSYLLAEREGKLLGFIAAEMLPQGKLFIHRLYLHPQAKGQGLGRQLMDAMLASFPQARMAHLFTHRRNPAVSFYLKQGFRIVRR